jgi:hypothetical protein
MTDTENTPNTEAEVTAELAKPTDISEYVAERTEQAEADRPPEDEVDVATKQLQDKYPELKEAKKASRYERLKRARDQYKAEAEELRSRLGQSAEEPSEGSAPRAEGPSEARAPSDGDTARLESSLESAQLLYGGAFDQAYQAFIEHCQKTGDKAAYDQVMSAGDVGQALVQWHDQMGNPTASPEALEVARQQGREQQDFQTQLAARDAEVRAQAELNLRVEQFAALCPDFHQAVEESSFMYEGVNAPVFQDLVRRSPLAPEIAYLMAKDVFSDNSLGILEQVQAAQSDPIAQARLVGALEQVIFVSRKGGSAPMPRATKAPPPLSQVRGGANPPRDLHSLASKDSAEDYIAARRRSAS